MKLPSLLPLPPLFHNESSTTMRSCNYRLIIRSFVLLLLGTHCLSACNYLFITLCISAGVISSRPLNWKRAANPSHERIKNSSLSCSSSTKKSAWHSYTLETIESGEGRQNVSGRERMGWVGGGGLFYQDKTGTDRVTWLQIR